MRPKSFYLPVIFFILFLMSSSLLQAQEAAGDSTKEESKPYSFNFGADVVSRYVWRGIELGESMPQVQPYGSFDLDLKSNGSFSLGLWGSYGFTGNYAENDFYLKYSYPTSVGTFSATATDYYYPYIDSLKLSDFKNDGEGAHTMEAAFLYTGPEAFPISFTFSKNIYNDTPGEKSLYVELGYPVAFNGTSLNFFAGAAQGPSEWHCVTGDKFQVINLGFNVSKEIKITQDYSLPVGLSFIMNPHINNTYVVFKVSF